MQLWLKNPQNIYLSFEVQTVCEVTKRCGSHHPWAFESLTCRLISTFGFLNGSRANTLIEPKYSVQLCGRFGKQEIKLSSRIRGQSWNRFLSKPWISFVNLIQPIWEEINKLFLLNLWKQTIHRILILICRLMQAVSTKAWPDGCETILLACHRQYQHWTIISRSTGNSLGAATGRFTTAEEGENSNWCTNCGSMVW